MEKKMMIITVGRGSGVEHGILFSIKEHKPTHLYFIYSKDSETTLNTIEEELGLPSDQITKKQLDEVNNIETIYREYLNYIQEIIEKGFNPNQIIVDYTSGTKAMSSALVSVAFHFKINTISYVYGERDKGIVKSGTEKLSSLSPNVIYIEEKLTLFESFFNEYQFESALKLIENLKHPDYDNKLTFYRELAKAYGAWDRFEYGKAKDIFQSFHNKKYYSNIDKKQQDLLQEHKQFLKQLTLKEYNSELINDLYSNAKRRFEKARYDDCVSRLYRLLEMLAQKKLGKLGYKTDSIPKKELPESLKEKYKNSDNDTVKLSLKDSFEFLNAKDPENEVAKKFFENKKSIDRLLSIRNGSFLAHGLSSIEKKKPKKCLA